LIKKAEHRPAPDRRRAGERGALAVAGILLALLGGHGAQAADLPQVLTGVNLRFDGAQLPVTTGSNMVIDQFADKATLHWQSFDIGAGHGVEFRQPSETAVALNRIFDGKPSEIRGRLTANGQIYLINSNGIVFGDGAQVSTQSLVASTLDIDDQVYEEIGFVNAINAPAGALPAFDSFGRPMGEIRIEPGATLDAARTGRILIFAPRVVNEGTIRTPEGQQVLAGVEDRVLVAASDDPDLRGLLVEVSTGGEVTNLGSLIAERGNISLLGLAVNQDGVARATTSVSLNGSIRLRAQDMNGTLALSNDLVPRKPKPVRGGELTLGSGSVTEVVPDRSQKNPDGTEVLAADAQSQPQSAIDLAATRVHIEGGARVTSTGGAIGITAAVDPGAPALSQPGDPATVPAEVVIGSGAILDASGDDSTSVSVARNVVEVEARGNELADSPLQRDGPIRNETLRVDVRRGTDFLDISGAVAAIGRSAGERQSAGGSITIRSEGRFSLAEGAGIDVSGGAVTYTEGLVRTSRLRQANGKVVEITNADPDQTYLGLVDDLVSREAGYVEGRDAGALTLQARGLELAGDIRAGSLAGVNQRRRPQDLGSVTPAYARPWDQVPLAGALALNLLGPASQELVLGSEPPGTQDSVPPFVISSGQLRGWGAGRLGLGNAGPVLVRDAVELPAWTDLTLTGTEVSVLGDIRIPGGQVRLNSTDSLVGEIVTPDADDLLIRVDSAIDLSGTWVNDNPALNRTRPSAPIVLNGGRVVINSGASIELGASSRLDVSAGAYRAADGKVSGGRGGDIAFATGVIGQNAAFGSRLALAGELRAFGFGEGGTLDISTERVRIVPASGPPDDSDLRLEGSRQFALDEVTDVVGNRQYIVEIGAGAFQQGGFRSWSLESSRDDLEVTSRSSLWLRTANLQLVGNSAAFTPTGTAVGALAAPTYLPEFKRRPMTLDLASEQRLGNTIGAVAQLTVAPGAVLLADAGSSISLRSTTGLVFDGTIEAPSGTISLELGGGPPAFRPEQMIWLGPQSVLRASGTTLIDTLDPLGLRRGEVLDAGRVTVSAHQGSIIGAPGSVIAVDGAVATLDTGLGLPVRREVASAAGSIELIAAESLLWKGRLSGLTPEGFSVPGGHLTVAIDPTNRSVPQLIGADGIPRGPHRLVMQDFTGTLPGPGMAVDPQFYSTGFVPLAGIGAGGFDSLDLVVRSSATATDGAGVPVPDTPQSLPVVEFPDDLVLRLDRSLRLDAAIIKTDAAQVSLTSPYVGIGYADARVRLEGAVPDKTSATRPQEATTPIRLTPTAGAGSFSVAGELIELVGEAVTQGFGSAASGRAGVVLDSSGDVRARGVRTVLKSDYSGLFRTAGDLLIEARRTYPTTLSEFELGAEGAGGQIVLLGGDSGASAPLSVGGQLTVTADRIVQGGALFAPLGDLDFVAGTSLTFTAGSLTSTTAAGLSAPFFRTEPGGALVLPAPSAGEDQIVFAEAIRNPEFERLLPEKRLRLSAPDISLQAGSRFDLRGGGEVTATEFVPGPGGTADILLADLDDGPGVAPNESFAILPAVGVFAPWDPLETPAAEDVQGLRIGDTLVLEDATNGLPAGEYAILPARYALFGGFLVTPEAGYQDLLPGQSLRRLDGAPILAGRLGVAGSDAAAGRSQGFAIENGEQVRLRAEYLQTPLDALYQEDILGSPRDAGSLVIAAEAGLELRGELIRGESTGGLGTAVDIASTAALAIVRELTGAGSRIELLARDLAGLGADSLLLGGTRARAEGGVALDPTTGEIMVEAGIEIDVPELVMVGERIVVEGSPDAPTRLASSRPARSDMTRLFVEGDTAVLALSDRRLGLQRASGTVAGSSSLVVAEGATLAAGGSVIADALGDVELSGALSVTAGMLSLGAASISIGATDGQDIGSGLVLSNVDLAAIAGSDLSLRSSGLLDVYGAVIPSGAATSTAFASLTIDAPGIRGLATDDDIPATFLAENITLVNRSGASVAAAAPVPATGSALELRALRQLAFGDGTVAVQGYEDSRFVAGDAVVFSGDNAIAVDGDLAIGAPVITAARTANVAIAAAGNLAVTGAATGSAIESGGGLGAALAITAADIDFDGRIFLPSGNVVLSGDKVRLGSEAVIDVSGEALDFGPKRTATPGGSIGLTARTGTLELASGALLDVSGAASGGEAGEIALTAPLGAVRVAPGLQILGQDVSQSTGRFLLDARRIESNDPAARNPVTALNALLDSGGFRGSRSLRLRQQDVEIDAGSTIRAQRIRLVADSGAVTVAGSLDASGPRAGSIWLAAGDALGVSGSLSARATDAAAAGGRVDLYALDADGDDPGGVLDRVAIGGSAVIDVSGGAGGAGGSVFVHARRIDTDSDGQTDQLLLGDIAGTITGAGRAEVIATRLLRDPGATQFLDPETNETVTRVSVDAGVIESWRSETETFLAGLPGLTVGALRIAPGLQVESSGDLVLRDRWNFTEGWYFGRDLADPANPVLGQTGIATLRAGRNLDIEADLTDSFAEQFIFGFQPVVLLAGATSRFDANGTAVGEVIPLSWAYRLSAGADLASADVMAVGAGRGDVDVGAGVRVRTGTGDIDLAAGRDLRLQAGAAVYSGGWDRGLSENLKQAIAPSTEAFGQTAYDYFGSFLNGGQFPVGGGAVTVTAGNDLVGAGTPGPVTAWLTRVGSGVVNDAVTLYSSTEGYGAVPTHWAVSYEQFRDGIGAFGGGDLRVAAGRDAAGIVLAAPNTGRVVDGVVADTGGGLIRFQPSNRTTEVLGGGDLDLRVGGDLAGGQIVSGGDRAVLRIGGGTGAQDAPTLYASGGAAIDWLSGLGLTLAGMQDPTVAPLSETQLTLLQLILGNYPSTDSIDNRFFTYADDSRVSLGSLGGDVTLDGPGFGGFLPPSLTAVAYGGDVNVVATPIEFFPSPIGQLELIARDDVTGNFSGSVETRLRQTDLDRATLPSVDRPDLLSGSAKVARVPVHSGDAVPNLIVARDGSIQSQPGRPGFWTLELAKPSILQAGADLSNLSVRVQNIAQTALSAFRAGRDIVQGELRDNTGRFAARDPRIFEISGPGSAEFLAGRDISLGTSAGIESIGNARNPALPAEGASLRLLAGTGGEPAWDRFIEVYLSTAPSEYRDALNAFVAQVDAGRAGFNTSSGKSTQVIEAGEAGFALDEIDEAAFALIEPAEDPAALAEALGQNSIPIVDDDPVATYQSLDEPVQAVVLTDVLATEMLAAAAIPVAGNDPSATFGSLDRSLQRNLLTDAVIRDFLDGNEIPVGEGGPLATFQSLDRSLQRILITDVLFRELGNWGSASETPDRADRLNYVRGFTALDTLFELGQPVGDRAEEFAAGAIEAAVQEFLAITDPQAANEAQVALFGTLFPPRERRGDIRLLLSQVQTLAGGALSMLAPTGDINAGAADADIIDKEASDLGIVTASGGNIDIYVDRDLLVNSTRVFALQGDLLIWSSNGDIDAGKGAKTVTSVPDPITVIDAEGNTIIQFPPAVAGSGLQGENAALFAPRGAVNAGDAGIRALEGLTVGAIEVIGADNIEVGGVALPTAAPAVAPPTAASASSAATKGMESQASMLSEANEAGERTIEGTQVSFVTVEVLSFGEGEVCDPEKEDCD
jgi:filamentous hemagglutinin family protein